MGRYLSVILIALVTVFLITNIYPELLVYALLFTFGLAFPLLFINSLLLYFLAALPLLIELHKTPRRWAVIALAACTIPAVAFVLPMLAEAAARMQAEWLRAGDVYARLSVVPKSIEIVGDWPGYPGSKERVADAPCEPLCQRLLLSRRVDLVRVTRATAVAFQLDYVLEQRGNCPSAFGQGVSIRPQTLDAIAAGTCFVARPPDATPMTGRIVIRKTSSREPTDFLEDLAAPGKITGTQVLEILTANPAGGWSREVRHTEVEFSYWTAPLRLIFAQFRELRLGRPVFARAKRMLHPFDPEEVAVYALRVEDEPLDRPQDQDRPQDRLSPAARAMAVLDRAGDVLSYEQVQVIVAWAHGLPCEFRTCPPATREDEEVAMRLARDRRLPDMYFGRINVYRRNPTLVVDNFDLFLDEMEARGANSVFSNMIGVIIARLDDAIVRPRGDRLLALIRANDWRWKRGMGIISGRLGLDTTALISERLASSGSESAETAALAACLADEAIGRELVPSLLAYFRAPGVSKPGVHTVGRPLAIDRYVLRALARFGHFEEAKELFVLLHPPPYDITTSIAYDLERAAELAGNPNLGSRQSAPAPAPAALNDVNPCYGGYLRP